MNMRDQWRMAFSAARLATCVDNREFAARIPSRTLQAAVNYALTERGDRLAHHFPLRILRIQNDRRYYAANPHMRPGGFNCRCMVLPATPQ